MYHMFLYSSIHDGGGQNEQVPHGNQLHFSLCVSISICIHVRVPLVYYRCKYFDLQFCQPQETHGFVRQ